MQLELPESRVSAHSAVPYMIRPIRPDDGARLQHFIRKLSPASRYARFMMPLRELPDYMLDRFIHPVSEKEAVWVATAPFGSIVGLGQYVQDERGDGCEVALVVDDAWQRRGLGTQLLQTVLNIARDSGVTRFHSEVFADNYPMRALARKIGCNMQLNPEAGFLVQISGSLNAPSDVSSVGLPNRAVSGNVPYGRACASGNPVPRVAH